MPAWSGLWNDVHSEDHSLLVDKPKQYRDVAMALRRRSLTNLREVIDTVASGSTVNADAAVTYPRVQGTETPGDVAGGGGSVNIETVTVRAASTDTTAAEATIVDGLVDYSKEPSTYVADAAGNGGGGDNDKTWPLGV